MRFSGSKRASKMETGAVELIECRARFISWWYGSRSRRREDESARRVHPAALLLLRIIAVTCELHAIGMLSVRAMLSP